MASVRFTKVGQNGRGSPTYLAEFSPAGEDLPRGPQMRAADMLKPRPGQRGYYPQGIDRDAPRR